MLGKVEGKRRRDEMDGRQHRLSGDEFEYALGVGDGQESLMCCSPQGRKESDVTKRRSEQQIDLFMF